MKYNLKIRIINIWKFHERNKGFHFELLSIETYYFRGRFINIILFNFNLLINITKKNE